MSATSDLEKRQQELAARDDLKPFAGEWVAVRDGRVVAHDVDLAQLREDRGVEPTDVLIAVGKPTDGPSIL